MDVALGSAATGVFTNSSWLWTHLYEVGYLHLLLNHNNNSVIAVVIEKLVRY